MVEARSVNVKNTTSTIEDAFNFFSKQLNLLTD